jgi:hypothetical protein
MGQDKAAVLPYFVHFQGGAILEGSVKFLIGDLQSVDPGDSARALATIDSSVHLIRTQALDHWGVCGPSIASVTSGSSIGSASRVRGVEEGSAGYGVGGRDGHPGRDTSSCYCSRDDNNSSGSFRYGRAGHPDDRHSAHNASANAYCRDDAGSGTDEQRRDAQHR